MKFLYILPLFLIVSCSGAEEDNLDLESEIEDYQENVTTPDTAVTPAENINQPGNYQEFHPNGALKIEGLNNMYGNREGLWAAFYEDGTKWSENFYSNGVKSGHSITFFPNGNVRYVGEYRNDERIGVWKFYDEEGNITGEENFSK